MNSDKIAIGAQFHSTESHRLLDGSTLLFRLAGQSRAKTIDLHSWSFQRGNGNTENARTMEQWLQESLQSRKSMSEVHVKGGDNAKAITWGM